ncbi:MAG: discoidin domain-containing protein [Proteobacteria bacterium]|nr:discoidin domain-containing protein [Pseudomonadota bacterium]
MSPAMAIDGDPNTRWDGNFSPGAWWQVDFGRDTMIGGAIIHWDAAFAPAYIVQASLDGRHWQNAFQTADSLGGVDYVVFPSVRARYLRLASPKDAADAGVSLYEFEPLPAADAPRIVGADKGIDAAGLWGATVHSDLVTPGPEPGTRQLHITFAHPLAVSGLEVFWNASRRGARLEGLDASGDWHPMGDDPSPLGDTSYLAAGTARPVTELRLTVYAYGSETPAIRRLRLLSRTQAMTPFKRYEIFAGREHPALFPPTLHHQQVYWTALSVPAGETKSLFDEYADLEPVKDGPLLQPLWRDSAGRVVAAFGLSRTQRLRGGWIPMPQVDWSPQAGLAVRSEAIAVNTAAGPVTLVRHHLENTGTRDIDGQFALVVRPMQVNPVWQNGGISEIRTASFEGQGPGTTLTVNGRPFLTALTGPSAQGVAGFASGQTEITRYVIEGGVPTSTSVRDPTGLAGAVMVYAVHLEPRDQYDIVLLFPLGATTPGAAARGRRESTPDEAVPAITTADAFDRVAALTEQQWRNRLLRVGLELPDPTIVDTLRAQVGYMLVNAKGPILLAGPRNYSRSFIRDGSATASILLRMGVAGPAREYLRWYAEHGVRPSGLISPILNDDGSINKGVGSELEYDSQGEFVSLVADVARLDGGAASVREYLPAVRGALKYLQTLRERTLAPGYQARSEAPQRFQGILGPSISHEGYPAPTHSYWDDYWALKGWHDGAWLARQWQMGDLASWATDQEAALRDAMAASIRATMAWKHIDYIPASADFGDVDPTSVSIALDPSGQQAILPDAALHTTFTRYLEELRRRSLPGARYAYSPYEFRNVLTFVHLDEPLVAEEVLNRLRANSYPPGWRAFAEVVRSPLRQVFYLGDMPHTWVGAEYARAVIGMLMHEDDNRLVLLPGTPPDWVAGKGITVEHLPTAFGALSMTAQEDEHSLKVQLGPTLNPSTEVALSWPRRQRPRSVTVDGKPHTEFSDAGIRLPHPFRELTAQW